MRACFFTASFSWGISCKLKEHFTPNRQAAISFEKFYLLTRFSGVTFPKSVALSVVLETNLSQGLPFSKFMNLVFRLP
jgi:hypothetical protein